MGFLKDFLRFSKYCLDDWDRSILASNIKRMIKNEISNLGLYKISFWFEIDSLFHSIRVKLLVTVCNHSPCSKSIYTYLSKLGSIRRLYLWLNLIGMFKHAADALLLKRQHFLQNRAKNGQRSFWMPPYCSLSNIFSKLV